MASSPPAARAWGVQKLLTSFTALKPKKEGNETPTPSSATKPNAVLMAALLKSLNPQASSSTTVPAAETAMGDKFGMSRSKVDTMFKFCGLDTGEETHLPKYLDC